MHRLSCKRCQHKKLKCSRTEPCDKCLRANVPCEYQQVDQKRRPASHDHVIVLQSRIDWLESFIAKLQCAGHTERDALLQAINLTPAQPPNVPEQDIFHLPSTESLNNAMLHPGPKGSLLYHGPTSIYRVYTGDNNTEGKTEASIAGFEHSSNVGHVLDHFGIDISANIVIDSLMLFFKWQYPHLMFVYRDAFLRDHFGDRKNSKYWSPALLLSICALGSLLLEDTASRSTSEQFYGAAESIALVTGLTRPSIITVQVFLCLAFYEIGRGNTSKGWAYSGIGFRMAQELGFQKDPKSGIIHDISITAVEDLEIRRRVYWGCYISDKLISLILGRPVYLGYGDAEVEHLQTQVDPPFMKPWRSVGFDDDSEDNNSMIPYIKEQIKLSQIIEKILYSLFTSQSALNSISHRQTLDNLNIELCAWKAQLPPWADFNKWDPIAHPLKPSLAALHLLFHSARIALNLDEGVTSDLVDIGQMSRHLCTSSSDEIMSIMRKLRHQYGLKHSPIALVYGVVQAGRAIGAFGATEAYHSLSTVLSECSTTWELAQQMMAIMFPGFAEPNLETGYTLEDQI